MPGSTHIGSVAIMPVIDPPVEADQQGRGHRQAHYEEDHLPGCPGDHRGTGERPGVVEDMWGDTAHHAPGTSQDAAEPSRT